MNTPENMKKNHPRISFVSLCIL